MKDFKIGDLIEFIYGNYGSEHTFIKGIIRGFNKNSPAVVVESMKPHFGHTGNMKKYWYDENGRDVFHTRKTGATYYYVPINLLKLIKRESNILNIEINLI